MAGGMIGAGGGYQRNALSGLARVSAEEQQRQTANQQLHEQEKQQNVSVGVSAASLIATIAIAAWSDERLKNILQQFTRGLSDIAGISPITFKYNELSEMDQTEEHSGFSAQNLLECIPEAVQADESGYYKVDPMPLLAAAINAIKELKAEVEQLKAERG